MSFFFYQRSFLITTLSYTTQIIGVRLRSMATQGQHTITPNTQTPYGGFEGRRRRSYHIQLQILTPPQMGFLMIDPGTMSNIFLAPPQI